MGNSGRKPPRTGPYVPPPAPHKKLRWQATGLPGPPGKPVLVPGEEDVVGIRWDRSADNGGSAIIGYHVEQRKMGSAHWVRSAPVLCTLPELALSGLEPGWRYQFRIRAQNALGLSEPSELSDPLSVTLQTTAAVQPRFDWPLQDCVATEGQQAEFTVAYSGTPLPKVCWFKDGFEIFGSRRTTINTDSTRSSLIIYRTCVDDEGEIKCSATNRAGHISTRARLIIEAAPHVRLPRQYDEGLLFEQGETIRLKATNGGRPPPSITWYHNGEIIVVDERHEFESITDNETVLKILEAKRQDRGEYTIRAINKLGEDVASFLLTVTDRPGAPTRIMITGTLGRSVTLAWSEPEDDGGCKIGTYIVEYYRLGWDVWLKAASCRQTTATLNELIEGSEYRFRVKAENPYGVSDPSEESNVIFIPDPKRGITEPNMRAKSASHRDIPRGRSERREVNVRREQPSQRTRSLTREEASNREAMAAYERTASTHRLQPSGSSRVTFALDTTSTDSHQPRRQWSKETLPPPTDYHSVGRSTRETTSVVVTPSFDDSGGLSRPTSPSLLRSHSPSPLVLEETTEFAIKAQVESMSQLNPPPRRRRSRSASVDPRAAVPDDPPALLHGSSEFMLVLYPGEEDGTHHHAQRLEKPSEAVRRGTRPSEHSPPSDTRAVDDQRKTETHDSVEDLIPPPMSFSLPELFSIEHQVVEVIREAVSSSELLHERAMERFYRAIEAQKSAEQLRAKSQPADMFKSRPVRRRLSNSGAAVTTWQSRRDRRRSSEGQPSKPEVVAPDLLHNVLSNPSLPTSNEMLAQNKAEPWPVGGELGGSAERLRRWHREPGIDLSNEESIAAVSDKHSALQIQHPFKLTQLHTEETSKVEEEYDEVAPDMGEILAEDSIETSGVSSELESSDGEDIKQLKARIMSIPVVGEEDTYNPRGRMIMNTEMTETPPPVPPHRYFGDFPPPPVPDRTNLSPTNLTPATSNNAMVPKSILKKRTDNEPLPVNQFGRPVPPEKPIRKSHSQLPLLDGNGSTLENDVRASSSMGFTADVPAVEAKLAPEIPNETITIEPAPIKPAAIPAPIKSMAAPAPVKPLPIVPPPIKPVAIPAQMKPVAIPAPIKPSTTPAPIKPEPIIPEPMKPVAMPLPVAPVPTATPPPSPSPLTQPKETDSEKDALISAGEAAVNKRKQMRQGSKTLSAEETEEEKEEKAAVVNHYTELVRQYSHPDFRQRSLSRDRETKRFESPSESRVSSPVQNQFSYGSVQKERHPITPGKIIEPIPPTTLVPAMQAKIITPIPPVMPTTPIQRAKPIDPSEYKSRRGSLKANGIEPEPPVRGRSRKQESNESRRSRQSSTADSRSTTPTRRRTIDAKPVADYDRRPPSRNESPMPRSRNVSRDRGQSVAGGSRSSSTTRGTESRRVSEIRTRGSRPSSRSSSKDRSRATTPTDIKMERLQRALDDKKGRLRRASTKDGARQEQDEQDGPDNGVLNIETEKKVRTVFSYFTDVALLLAALYVYLFKREIFAIPIIALLLYRYIVHEINGWTPAWFRRQRQ